MAIVEVTRCRGQKWGALLKVVRAEPQKLDPGILRRELNFHVTSNYHTRVLLSDRRDNAIKGEASKTSYFFKPAESIP
jgi:hypothetical protein